MKKIFLYTLCLLFCAGTVDARPYGGRQDGGFLLGINAGYTYPLGDMGKIVKNGFGGNISAKYLINRIIGIGFESGYHSFKTKILLDNNHALQDYKCRLIPILFETTFYIPTWDQTILPYLGLHFGAYVTNVNVSQEVDGYSKQSKNLYLFSPGGGIDGGALFQLSDQVYLDVKIKADYVTKIEDKYELKYDEEYSKSGRIGFNKMTNLGVSIGLLYRF